MSNIVITVDGLGKKYIIGHQTDGHRYTALRDVLMMYARTLWLKTKGLALGKPLVQGDSTEEIWALRNICLEICQGEVIGIIGRNGAGKSTLLKVLSRITEPTCGRVTIDGRVASLLEVGTGFHPELTGRENIYLNGAILGMSRTEIKQKYDEIVAFAEVEKYLDTPVKRYSSGMYVRLAFAVAAHLEPEILLIDEVLAVGDAHFQKKCLGKMEDVAHEGRTVLFVSHNMTSIENLCPRTILLDGGIIGFDGNTNDALDLYLKNPFEYTKMMENSHNRPGLGNIRVSRLTFFDKSGFITHTFKSWDCLVIRIDFKCYNSISKPNFKVTLYSYLGQHIANFSTNISGFSKNNIDEDGYTECIIDNVPLCTGRYRINVSISSYDVLEDHVDMAGYFNIEGGDPYRTGLLPEVGHLIIIPTWKWNS